MAKIDGRGIGVSEWVTADPVVYLYKKIKSLKPNYNPDFHNKSHL